MTLGGNVRYSGQDDAAYGLRVLSKALVDLPNDLRKTVRPRLVASGEGLRAQAAANAAWSKRIPRSLKVRVKFTGSRPGVYVLASRAIAPHARPIEGITGNATFRHPVMGDRDVWVEQPTRSFLAEAARQRGDEVVQNVTAAVEDALRAAGLK